MAGGGARLPHPGAARARARKRRRPRGARRVRYRRGGASRQSLASRISTIWLRNTPTSTCASSTGRRPANPSGSTRTGFSSRRPCSTSRPGTSVHSLVSQDWAQAIRGPSRCRVALRRLSLRAGQGPRRSGRRAARFLHEHSAALDPDLFTHRVAAETPLAYYAAAALLTEAYLKDRQTAFKRRRTCPGLPRPHRSKAPNPSSPARTR